MKAWVLAVLLLFGPVVASADMAAETYRDMTAGCVWVTLCDAETDTTAACDRRGDNIVADVRGRSNHTLFSTQSTATTYSCQIYQSDAGYSATARQQTTATALSASQTVISLSGLFGDVWAECSTITGGNVTITLQSCPYTR